MSKLEGRSKIKCPDLLRYGGGNLWPAVPQTRGPEPGVTVKNPSTPIIRKPYILRGDDDPRITLELAVTGIGHPISV
jgi:hypothetical protein